jgi:hypothetical protein
VKTEVRGVVLLRIAVIDGQGASIGSTAIKRIRQAFGENVEVWALGTNAIATTQMLKAGANRGATGEGAICHSVDQVDVIIGSISILISNAFMGELNTAMAGAISKSRAIKLLLPLTQEVVHVVGITSEPLPHQIDKLINGYLAPLVRAKNGQTGSSPQ